MQNPVTQNPVTINGTQCNELAREVFYKALATAKGLIATAQFDADRVNALAALAEACANDFETEQL